MRLICWVCAETLISGFGFIESYGGYEEYMRQHGYRTLADMRDLVVPNVKSAPELILTTVTQGYRTAAGGSCKAACPSMSRQRQERLHGPQERL